MYQVYMISAGALPQTPFGELRAPPDLLAVFKGPIVLRGERKKRGREMNERGRRGRQGGGHVKSVKPRARNFRKIDSPTLGVSGVGTPSGFAHDARHNNKRTNRPNIFGH